MHAARDDRHARDEGRDDAVHEDALAWRAIDDAITRLAGAKGAIDAEIGRWLLVAQRERVERKVGFASFTEYVERRLGYDARTTHERLRVARALETLPRLDALLRSGARSWSAVRELTRVATAETEGAWVAASERLTVRQVEALVAGRAPGDGPEDARDPVLARHRLVVELAPDELAEWREAAERVRREIGPAASDREVLRALVQKALGARPDDRPAYQTAVTLCLGCERAWQQAGGDVVEVSPAIGACARCDGEVVGVVGAPDEGVHARVSGADEQGASAHVGDDEGAVADEAGEGASAHVGDADPPATNARAAAAVVDGGTAAARDPTERHAAALVRAAVAARGGRALARILADVVGAAPKTMTPKLRAAVRARDRRRCVVPGCRHFRFVELHHQRPRAQGGPNTAENLLTLCSQHHRLVHEGVLAIEGSPATGLVVRHAGGALYGAVPRTPVHAEDAAA